jgi:hypothetical protein
MAVGIRALIRDLGGKPAIYVEKAALGDSGEMMVAVIVEGESILLTPSGWNGLLAWGGPLPEGYSSRYL